MWTFGEESRKRTETEERNHLLLTRLIAANLKGIFGTNKYLIKIFLCGFLIQANEHAYN
ncbi:hypothetical protein [uncultured Bacteroides sp.]|jgi:hypothetical protein|uniref:hypothetical protein n=1 Tax=uncultured Bacteroides sp. TaxID=162156 RepID=UPI00261BB95B|nr:hypothetical protein [uncultured Bacteroides sp.]